MDNLIDKKFEQLDKEKINSLQLIGEIYDEGNLSNYYRDYIINHCSKASIDKMFINSYDQISESIVSASLF
jgi:hypothetical protein